MNFVVFCLMTGPVRLATVGFASIASGDVKVVVFNVPGVLSRGGCYSGFEPLSICALAL